MPFAVSLFKRHHTNMLHVVLFAVGVAWVACQIWIPAAEQPPILTNALQVAFGAWLADLAYDQRSHDQRRDDRIDVLEKSDTKTVGRVGDLEDVADQQHPEAFGDVLRQHRHERRDEEGGFDDYA